MTGDAQHTPALGGIKVLDLTNVLAGPFCVQQLAHMGADVIKVERPGTGDLARQLGADPGLNERLMGASFLAQNAGKRSITLNLAKPTGKDILRRLAKDADVLVENFRPGVMARLGLGPDDLRKVNPRLVYCAISGFGQEGPLAHAPAYDQVVQGLSGVMSITGTPQTAPLRTGFPVADTMGGMTAAFAIAAELAKPPEKRGATIDVSMLASLLAAMGWAVSNHLVAGQDPAPLGNDNMTASPSGTFKTKDGLLNIAANKQEQFETLCDLLGDPGLKSDPMFAARQARLDNRDALSARIEQALAAKSANDWAKLLNARGVPAGEVLTVSQVLAHPQTKARDMLRTYPSAPGAGRDITTAQTGIRIGGASPGADTSPPTLGQHTREILAGLGYSDAEIDAFKDEGVT